VKLSSFYIGLAAALALTLVGGVLQGHIRYRWGPSKAMAAAAKGLEEVPLSFGGPRNDRWTLKSSEQLLDETREMLECTGYIVRTYEKHDTGELVSMFVLIGPAGPIAAHTPEICYSVQEYTLRDARQRVAVAGAQEQDDQFWALTFKTKGLRENLLRVYYAWSTDGRWLAVDHARYGFVGAPYLYKIQVSSELPAGSNLASSDTCREFLKDFLPVLRQHLISTPQQEL
jgi:hypothetical protein